MCFYRYKDWAENVKKEKKRSQCAKKNFERLDRKAWLYGSKV